MDNIEAKIKNLDARLLALEKQLDMIMKPMSSHVKMSENNSQQKLIDILDSKKSKQRLITLLKYK